MMSIGHCAVVLLGLTAACAPQPSLADADHPAVVELYQSQGCSSCPPADAVFARFSRASSSDT